MYPAPMFSPKDKVRILYRVNDEELKYWPNNEEILTIKEVFHGDNENRYTIEEYPGSFVEDIIVLADEIDEKEKEEKLDTSMEEKKERDNLINLLPLFYGKKGAILYNDTFGNVKLKSISHIQITFQVALKGITEFTTDIYGRGPEGDLCIFPSKDQKSWKIYKEQNPIPVWTSISQIERFKYDFKFDTNKPLSIIEKSTLAYLRILIVIDRFFDGVNVSGEKGFEIRCDSNLQEPFHPIEVENPRISLSPFRFKSFELAQKFLAYPENRELLRDYFMLPDTLEDYDK